MNFFKNKNTQSEIDTDSNKDVLDEILNSENLEEPSLENNEEDLETETENEEDVFNTNENATKEIKTPKKLKSKISKNKTNKNKSNKKTILVLGIVIVLLVALFAGAYVFMSKDKGETILPPTKTEEQIAKEKILSSINKDVKIGQAKASIVEKFSIPKEKVGKNYAIDPTYTRIGNYDFLTTYIFSEDSLVAVLHERILDGTQKHKLSIEFQKFTEEIGGYYPLIEMKKEWFVPELEYDANAWNEAITNNQLELYSNFENTETKEYVKIVASGINYFNFLANDRESLSLGNLNLIYTSSDYKDKFMSFVSLATE